MNKDYYRNRIHASTRKSKMKTASGILILMALIGVCWYRTDAFASTMARTSQTIAAITSRGEQQPTTNQCPRFVSLAQYPPPACDD